MVNTDTTFTAPSDGPFVGIQVIDNATLTGNNLVIGPGSPNRIGLLLGSTAVGVTGHGILNGGSITQSQGATNSVFGVYLRNNSTANLSGTSITLDGKWDSAGIMVNGAATGTPASVTGNNLTIELSTTESSSPQPSAAIYAWRGKADISNSTLTLTGSHTYGLLASGNTGRDTEIISTNNTITTDGLNAYGAFAYTDPTGKAVINIVGGTIQTKGLTAHGLRASGESSDAEIHVSGGASIATAGDGAVGAYARYGNKIFITDSSLKTTGLNADGAKAEFGSPIEMTGVSLVTEHTGARGLVAIDSSTFTVKNSTIDAGGWAAAAYETGNSFTLSGTTMKGAEGLLYVDADSSAVFSAHNSTLTGRILTEANANSDVTLTGGTRWNMTADSNVSTLTNTNSTIAFAPGGAFKTLTVDGNYTGNAGRFVLNTKLGGDASPTDMLVVKGNTAGTSFLRVVNAGGAGAPTVEGIKVVQVDGASNGRFSLLGDYTFRGQQAVVAGAYAYTLNKNGVANPSDGNWYLRSSMTDAGSGGKPGGGSGGGSGGKPGGGPGWRPILQPGAPLYETMPRVALGLMSLPTLQQRVGNRYWPDSAGQGNEATTEERGYWGRVDGGKIRVDGGFSTSDAKIDQDQWRAETGLDFIALKSAGGTFIGGVNFYYGHAEADIHSPFGVGRNETEGYGVGGTATWYGDTGFYADAQARVTWLDTDLDSHTLGRKLAKGADGIGSSFGLELGQRLPLTANWSAIPQAQLMFANVDYDNLVDPFGSRVNFGNDDSLLGRFGIALQHDQHWRNRAGELTRMSFYGIANLYQEFLDGTSVTLAGLGLGNEDADTWMGGGLGGSFNMNGDAISLYGEVTAATNVSDDSGDSYGFGGKGGLRVRW